MQPEDLREIAQPQLGHSDQTPTAIDVARRVTIPDHQLLKCIGSGSYGQIWLARNMLNAYRAVKIIFRESFKDQRPFERELSGIRKFEPISRLHEGFIDVLHTGINEERGYFYYIMELGDDQITGQNIDPDTYSPKTLGGEVSRRGNVSLRECVRLGIDLTQALADLHKHGLVHRDIKPSNIIFVNGRPKLADIGLVAGAHEARSYVGTEGFIPPEGPGAPQADLFSLGKVLYEASTGMDRQDFPELPAWWSDSPSYEGLLELNEVLLRACFPEPGRRYSHAEDMHADLLLVENGNSVKRLRLLERRMTNLKRTAGIAALALMGASALFYQIYREYARRRETRQQQVNANISYGNRAVDSGDLLGSLPFFARALQLEQGEIGSEREDRLRIGAALNQCPKLVKMWREPTRVNHGQFSPDGKRILLAHYYGTAEIWDYVNGQVYNHPFGPEAGLNSATYSPDGRFVATASQNNTAIIWDAQSLSEIWDFPHSNMVFSIRFSQDGKRVITSCLDGYAYVWNVASGQLELALGGFSQGVSFAEFNHHGDLIAIACYDGIVSIWSVATGQRSSIRLPHSNWVTSMAFSADDNELVTACDDHRAHVWDVSTGKRILPDLPHDGPVKSVQFSPDGRFILTASLDGTARLWRAEDLQPVDINPVLRHGQDVTCASFSPDGRLIITTCLDGSIRVWDLAGSFVPLPQMRGLFSDDASRYLTVTNNHVEVHDTASSKCIASLTTDSASDQNAQLNRDGRFAICAKPVATAGLQTNWEIKVSSVPDQRLLGPGLWFSNCLNGFSLSDNGKRLVTWSGNIAQIWDVALGAAISPPMCHGKIIQSAFFSPLGDRVLTISGAGAQLWDALTGERVFAEFRHPVPVKHAEFNHDGKYLVTCCSDPHILSCFAQVWDLATGKPQGRPLRHADGVLFSTFSVDGSRVATASEDFKARVWETQTGRAISLPLKHSDQVRAASFDVDGKWLVTASSDKTARLWDPDSSEALTPPLRHLRPLTNARFLPDRLNLLVQDEDGEAFLWPLQIDAHEVNDLVELSEFLSGGPMTSGEETEQNLKSTQATWRRLRDKFPDQFKTSPDEVIRWHRFQTEESELDQVWFAVKFHLEQLLRLLPSDPSLLERLTKARQNLDREKGSSTDGTE